MVSHVAQSAALRATDLTVGYRARGQRRTVLEGINLTMEPGELVCVLGPNGVGKSTLLRTLARLQPALRGVVELGGDRMATLSASELARRLGVVLTDRVLVESLTARRIVELGRYARLSWLGRPASRDLDVVNWAIDAVGMRHLAERDFSRLSDGERQRVMIARALAQEPVVLVLDEPTAFLDVPSRVEVMALLRQLTRESRLAAVASTHDLELALRTADVVWLLMPGGDVVTGAPEDLMLSGAIAQAFDGGHIRFHAESRTFRWPTGDAGNVVLHGGGARVEMAKAVLERHGYAIAHTAAGATFTVDVDESGWRVDDRGQEHHGHDFAALGKWLRERRTSVT